MDSQSAKRQLIDYIRKNSGLEQDRHYLGMSQIGRCPRLQHTWLLQGKGNPSDQAHLRCISGYMYEDKIRELLEGAGVTRHMPKAPLRSRSAPVNEPFLWPNISDSNKFSGIAAQLRATNALPARGDC